jgi:hypothetical protein
MIKRTMDVLFSLGGLIVLSPLLLIIAAAVALSSPGGVFYRAERVGKDGRLFKLYKFRSMVAGADKVGPAITVAGDARVTPVGKFLRKTKLDELPQLINVLKGEMSLVGPRPSRPNMSRSTPTNSAPSCAFALGSRRWHRSATAMRRACCTARTGKRSILRKSCPRSSPSIWSTSPAPTPGKIYRSSFRHLERSCDEAAIGQRDYAHSQ